MSLGSLLTGRLPVALVSSVVTAAIVGSATLLVSAQDGGDTTIHACVGRKGAVRIVSGPTDCASNETPTTWNKEGPKGDPGEPGEDGSDGSLTSLNDLAGIPCQVGNFTGETTLVWDGLVAVIECGTAVGPPPSGALLTTETPVHVDLGPLFAPADEPVVYAVTIRNSGDGPSNPLSAGSQISGGQSDEWLFSDHCSGKVLDPLETCDVIVVLNPKYPSPPGDEHELYVFVLDGSSGVNLWFSAAVLAGPNFDSDGDGSPDNEDCDDFDDRVYPGATEILDGLDNDCDGQVDEGLLPILTANPTAFDFGSRTVAEGPATLTVTVTNAGAVATAPLDVDDAMEEPFSVTAGTCYEAVLGPGQSCTISVGFAPNETHQPGQYGADIHVSTDDLLLGIGIAANLIG